MNAIDRLFARSCWSANRLARLTAQCLTTILLGLVLGGVPMGSFAQSWPDKPVHFVLSQPAGSGPDTIARYLAEKLTKTWGQSVIIDNKPGGQNVIGAQAVARAAGDGYTFYFATTAALVSNQFLFKSLPYDVQRDFTSVVFVANSPFGLFVKADSPLTSLPDFIAKSKSSPTPISIANEGPRTFGGIIARLLNAKAQTQSNLVSYSSVGVAVQDVLGGHADAALVDLASSAQLVKQGRLRLLAVTSAKRVPGFEQVPTFAESLPGFEMVGWFAVVAPAGTPSAVVDKLNTEINSLLQSPEVSEHMSTIGPIATAMGSSAKLDAFLKSENERWAQVSKEIGLLPE
jgi:tripartite-type tricarboxylate transporter receptor subunit TctC